MQNFEQVGKELERQGKADKIRALAQSEDGQKLSRMVDGTAVGQAAKNGDSEALKKMIAQVLGTDEGKRLAENIRKMMNE